MKIYCLVKKTKSWLLWSLKVKTALFDFRTELFDREKKEQHYQMISIFWGFMFLCDSRKKGQNKHRNTHILRQWSESGSLTVPVRMDSPGQHKAKLLTADVLFHSCPLGGARESPFSSSDQLSSQLQASHSALYTCVHQLFRDFTVFFFYNF